MATESLRPVLSMRTPGTDLSFQTAGCSQSDTDQFLLGLYQVHSDAQGPGVSSGTEFDYPSLLNYPIFSVYKV